MFLPCLRRGEDHIGDHDTELDSSNDLNDPGYPGGGYSVRVVKLPTVAVGCGKSIANHLLLRLALLCAC